MTASSISTVIATRVIKDQHPLRLLAFAISGRAVSISFLTDKNSKAFNDNERIYLPLSDSFEQQRDEVLVQCLLIAGGSLQRSLMPALVGRPELCRRYLLLEISRCANLLHQQLPSFFLRKLKPFAVAVSLPDAQASLTLAKSNQQLPSLPEWFGTIKPLRLLRGLPGAQHSSGDGQQLDELEAQLKKMQSKLEEDEDEDIVKDGFWQLFSSPKGKDGMFSKLLGDLLDMSSSGESKACDDSASGSMEMVSGRWVKRLSDASKALLTTLNDVIPSAVILNDVGTHSYPEWDCDKKAYKPDWTTIEEVDVHVGTGNINIQPIVFSSVKNIQYRQLLSGLFFSAERHRGQPQGDDLVLDKIVELKTNLLAGYSGDEQVYQANLKTRRDLGVQILVDVSSSTLESAEGGKRVCDVQMDAAWRLCQAFSDLGDRVAMHGFHSWGKSLVRLQRLKNFNEAIGGSVEQRCRQLSVCGYTRCGAAIRHGVQQLKKGSGMPCNLLIVISDGYPFDDQYEGYYAAEDTKKALEDARADNIACVCLSIGSDVNKQKLEAIYGDTNYLAVGKLDRLAIQLRPMIEKAISKMLKKNH